MHLLAVVVLLKMALYLGHELKQEGNHSYQLAESDTLVRVYCVILLRNIRYINLQYIVWLTVKGIMAAEQVDREDTRRKLPKRNTSSIWGLRWSPGRFV